MAQATIGALRVFLGLDSAQFSNGLKSAQGQLKGIGKSMQRAGRNMSAYVTAPLVGFGALTLKTAGDFQAAMNQVAAVSGATGEEFEALRELAKELGATTQFSASEAAEAMGFLAMAGMEANDILSVMPDTLQLASAAQLDMGSAADIVTNILAGYGKEVGELGHVTDVLVKAFTSSNTNLRDLAEAMKYVGPVASAAGVQFEEAAAAIGLMGNAGIQGSMAGTSLRGAMSRLLNPSKSVTKTIESLNLEAEEAAEMMAFMEGATDDLDGVLRSAGLNFTDTEGRLLPLSDIIEQLGPHAEDAGLFMEIFGDRAGPAMAALVSQGSDALRDLTKELEESGGTAERVSDVQMAGFNGAMNELKSAFQALQIAIADSGLLDFVTSMVKAMARWVQEVSKSSPQLLKWGTIIAGLAAAIGPLLIALGSMAVVAAALAGPFGLVILALGAVAGAAAYVAANWDDLKERFPILETGLEKLKAVFSAVWDGIKDVMEGNAIIIGGVIDTISGLLTGDLTLAIEGMKQVWEGMKHVAQANIKAILNIIEAIVPGFKQAATDIIDAVKDLPAQLKQWGIDMVQGFVDGIIETWDRLKASVRGIFWQDYDTSDAYAAGKAIGGANIQGAVDGMFEGKEKAGAAAGDIADYINDVVRDKNEIRSPSRVWMRIGEDLMGGLAVGIQGGAEQAAQAAAEAADRVSTSFTVPAVTEFNTLGGEISNSLSSAFKSGLDGATSFSDAMMSVMTRMRDRLIDQVFDQITNAIEQMFTGGGGGGLGSLLGSLFGGGGAFTSSMPSMPSGGIPIAFNAKGGVYSGPGISAYSGSVVSQPTVFPFAKGIGLMGEAGPEAILPLKRGPGGRLGVEAGGGGTVVQVIDQRRSGADIETSSQRGPDGREIIRMVVADEMARGSYDKPMRGRYGARPSQVKY